MGLMERELADLIEKIQQTGTTPGCPKRAALLENKRRGGKLWLFRFVQRPSGRYIATKCVPADDLMSTTREFALRLANGPAVAMQLAKRLVYRGLTADWQEAFEQAGTAMSIAQTTEDAREGPRAFVENRPPKFQGR